MKYTEYTLSARRRGEVVEVTLQGTEANVLLLDSAGLSSFKSGSRYSYYGGHYQQSPVRIVIPYDGDWYVVVNLGGLAGSVTSSIRVLPGALPPGPSLVVPRPAALRTRSAPTSDVTNRAPINPNASLAPIRQASDEYAELVGAAPEARVYDVFVCHASDDKDDVVRPLARALTELNVTCWYDESELHIGDSLRRKIDAGLSRCRFGVVVLSTSFFNKGWPNYELDGLVTREIASGGQMILPIWHGVTHRDVMSYSPSLAGKLARATAHTSIEQIAREIAEVTGARKAA